MINLINELAVNNRCSQNGHYKPILYITTKHNCHEVVSHVAKHPFGYPRIQYKGKVHKLHRLIWILEKGNITDGLHVLHKCDNPACINPAHLFLGTNDDNVRDMVNKKRNQKGERHWRAKLTENAVREIRARRDSGMLQKDIAAQYGISRRTVGQIIKRERWKQVN